MPAFVSQSRGPLLGTSGLSSSNQVINCTTDSLSVQGWLDTSDIPVYYVQWEPSEVIVGRPIEKRTLGAEDVFDLLATQYLRGELTLGEAAELLGLDRFEYERLLKEKGIAQEPQLRSKEEIERADRLLEAIR